MSVAALAPYIEASVFTLGCMGIHSLRRHAERVTSVLSVAVLALAVVVLTLLAATYSVPPEGFPYWWQVAF